MASTQVANAYLMADIEGVTHYWSGSFWTTAWCNRAQMTYEGVYKEKHRILSHHHAVDADDRPFEVSIGFE